MICTLRTDTDSNESRDLAHMTIAVISDITPIYTDIQMIVENRSTDKVITRRKILPESSSEPCGARDVKLCSVNDEHCLCV